MVVGMLVDVKAAEGEVCLTVGIVVMVHTRTVETSLFAVALMEAAVVVSFAVGTQAMGVM